MNKTVLHVYDPDLRLDGFTLLNMVSVTQGNRAALHIDREGGSVEVFVYGRNLSGQAEVLDSYVVPSTAQCGCP